MIVALGGVAPSLLQLTPVPLAVGALACHDDQQFVVVRSIQPNVLFQSLGKAIQFPSRDEAPTGFCPVNSQLSLVLNVCPTRYTQGAGPSP